MFLDHSDVSDIVQFFDSYYSHIYFIVYDSFVTAETNLRQKGAHKAQREELESVLYLLEKVLIFLPEALSQRWQYHSIGKGRLPKKNTSYSVTLSLKVGGGQDEITLLGAAKIVTS